MSRAAAVWGGVLLLGWSALVHAQATSTQQNPVHTFTTPGTHQVTLRSCNSAGCSTVTKTVTVLDPVPSILTAVVGAATAEVGQLIPVNGTGKGQPPLAYTWQILQGANVVRQATGAQAWLDTTGLAPGAYTVVLRLSNAWGVVQSLPWALVLFPPVGTDFYAIPPCRMLDTRIGPPLQSGVARLLSLDGACGIPSNARAVAGNVTAIIGTSIGTLAVYPGNYPAPGTSTVNFNGGQVITNNAIMGLSTDSLGRLFIKASVGGNGTVHATIDVFGYFAP